ncbi:hypothetical protein APY03_3761 [Variovorax sp. WDL1]|nr:hypothetical protein APY03_3761 [Variovorax sp. WDL1]
MRCGRGKGHRGGRWVRGREISRARIIRKRASALRRARCFNRDSF